VDIDGYRLTMIVVHHKSGRYNDYWREAESRKIVELVHSIEAKDPARNIVVMGDFNATESATSVLTYLEAGLRDGVARDASDPDRAWITHASGRRIDHILVNDAFASEIGGVSFVLGTPILPEGVDYREADPPEGYASDHFPVVIEFRPRD
ncbi:MAG: endonuclease/exonuclease/phosphatase family protein, partial [Phycisphaerales bacterium]|nr:endonuclease/exonuclease/phosphatase family protein [Phycisphaerales bacterium]